MGEDFRNSWLTFGAANAGSIDQVRRSIAASDALNSHRTATAASDWESAESGLGSIPESVSSAASVRLPDVITSSHGAQGTVPASEAGSRGSYAMDRSGRVVSQTLAPVSVPRSVDISDTTASGL